MTPRQLEQGLDLITGLIVVSVAVALAGLTWRLMGEPGGPPRQAVAVAPLAGPPPALDLTPVVQLAPFGLAVDPTGSAEGLGLTLRGILRAVPSSASTALISAGAAPAQAVGVGQSLAGGALVDQIDIDHVILRFGGRRQLLGFPEKKASADSAGVTAIRAAIPAAVSGLPPAPSSSASAAAPGQAPIASAIETYRDRASGGPKSFAESLGAAVTAQGYKIGPNPSPEMRSAGLQTGDLVQKVNGVTVGDTDRDRQVFDQAVVSGRARIEVQRDGRQIVMSFPLR